MQRTSILRFNGSRTNVGATLCIPPQVLHSTDLPTHSTTLGQIFTPPGGGDGTTTYESQCVTRDYYTQHCA